MDEILSQEEVNALIKGISDGDIDTEKSGEPVTAEAYEFPRVEESEDAAFPRLEKIAKLTADCVSESLTGHLKKPVEVDGFSVNYTTFEECLTNLPESACFGLFTMEPMKGIGLLALDGEMIFSLIDIFFGGNGKGKVERERGEFTPIEMKVIQKISQTVLGDVESVWKGFAPLKVSYIRTETDVKDLSFIRGEERVVVIEIGHSVEELKYSCRIIYPVKMLEPLREKLGGAVSGGDGEGEWRKRLHEFSLTVPVIVECVLGTTEISVLKGLRLREGETIILPSSPEGEVPLLVEGIGKFCGKLGSFRGNYAVRIGNAITE